MFYGELATGHALLDTEEYQCLNPPVHLIVLPRLAARVSGKGSFGYALCMQFVYCS